MLMKVATKIGLIVICLLTAYMAYTTNPASDAPQNLQTAALSNSGLKSQPSEGHGSHEQGPQEKGVREQRLTEPLLTEQLLTEQLLTEPGLSESGGKNIQTGEAKASGLTALETDITTRSIPLGTSDTSALQNEKVESSPVEHEKVKTPTEGELKAASAKVIETPSQIVTSEQKPNTEQDKHIKLALAKPDETTKSDETISQSDSKAFQPSSQTKTPNREDLKPLFDASLKSLQEMPLETDDKTAISEALKLIKKGKNADGLALAKKVKTPVGQKFILWYNFRNDPHTYSLTQLRDFLKENKDWPSQDNLRIAAESHLFRASIAAQKDYFSESSALTAIGMVTQASLLLKAGKEDEAANIIRQVWSEKESAAAEREILDNYKKYLTPKNIRMKADYYLYKGQIASSQAIAKHLDEKERKKVENRISILQKPKKTAQIIDALSAEDKLDPGILFERIKLARAKKNYEQAWELFKKAPTDPLLLGHPDAWWPERERLFREAFEQKKYTTAYDLVKNHGQLSVNNLNEAEFLAGWIAYRFLKKPEIGYKHFEILARSVDGPISKSKAYYWLGRTALALGEKAKAEKHFEDGSVFFNTFYGQLSRQSITPKNSHLELPALPVPSDQEIATFQNRDVIKAIMLAHHLEIDGMAGIFFSHLKDELQSPGEVILLAELAMRLGYHQHAVRIGKAAMARGINAIDYSYPIGLLPDFKALRALPESAFYYGITRQESEFNPNTVSHAGAKGLMQVMPITAKHVAQQHKIKFEPERLLKDTSYNVMIATAYIADRMDEYDGSYIKAIAGFNAGPGRVREWVKTFGDPSHSHVDPIDWIEGIPFDETRGYVVKVLSNIQMYRSRLGQPQTALQLRRDLYRDRKDSETANKSLLASN